MTVNLYDVSVAAFVPQIKALTAVFDRGLKFAEENKIDPAAMLGTRLYPNMFHLGLQIRAMCFQAQAGCALLAGREQPPFPRGEDSVEALKKLMNETLDMLAGIKPSDTEGAEDRPIKFKTPPGTEIPFKNGTELLIRFTAPNFYFHNTTAYNILRAMGVEIGKADFLRPRA
jgi:hypothetical protein